MAKVVKLRMFAGLSVRETADVTRLSERAVYRRWQAARAWLRREIDDAGDTATADDDRRR